MLYLHPDTTNLSSWGTSLVLFASF